MSPAYISILLRIIKLAMPTGFVEHVVALVQAAARLDISGTAKRAEVQTQLKTVTGDLKAVLATMSTNTVNLVVEIAVAYVNGKTGK